MSAESLIMDYFDVWTGAVWRNDVGTRNDEGSHELTGIDCLRELILDLAVRGRLVAQNPGDEPASTLLNQIAEEKSELAKAGRFRKVKEVDPVSDDEMPFELPGSWEWARLPNVAHYSAGKTPATKNPKYWESSGGTPWVAIGDMCDGGFVRSTSKSVSDIAVDEVFKQEPVEPGSILMSFKLTLGKVSINQIPVYHNEAIISVHPFSGVDRDYLFRVLPKRAQDGDSKSAIKGKTLNSTSLAKLLIPLPPVSEQKRIVEKVDELMALCDRLEQQTSDQIRAHETLVDTLLDTLTRSQHGAELADNWGRVAEHFDTLFVNEYGIDVLERTIVQLAVVGRLSEEPLGSDLRLSIRNRDANEAECGEEPARGTGNGRNDPEVPDQLPRGWQLMRVGDVAAVKGGKRLPKGHTLRTEDTGFPYIRVTNMKHGGIAQEDIRYLSPETRRQIRRYDISSDDLYITIAGTIGEVGEIPSALDGANLTENAAKIMPSGVNRKFLKLALRAPYVQEQFRAKVNQMAQPKLALHRIESTVIAIPAPSEQAEIVSEVDKLCALMEKLRRGVRNAEATRNRFVECIIRDIG